MKKYLTYLNVCFRAFFTYKADYLVGIVFSLVYFFIYFSLWKAIFSSSGQVEINTYTLANTITYYFVISLIFRLDVTNYIYLGNDIWNGNLTNDLVKPWNVVSVQILTTISDLLIELLLYAPFAIFIFIFALNYIILPAGIMVLFFIITVLLGIFLSFAINFFLHALTFQLGDQEGNIKLVNFLIGFLAGSVFPLTFLPDGIRSFFMALPFRYLFDFPANVFMNKVPVSEVFLGWAQMLGWGMLFIIIFTLVYRHGLKRYTGTGR